MSAVRTYVDVERANTYPALVADNDWSMHAYCYYI